MMKPWRYLLLGAVTTLLACGDGSLVVITVDSTTALTEAERLHATLQLGTRTREFDVALKGKGIPPSRAFGVTFEPDVKGHLTIHLVAFGANDAQLAEIDGAIDLEAGKRVDLPLTFGLVTPDLSGGEDAGVCGATKHECSGNCVSNTDVANCGSSCTPCPLPTNGNHTICTAGQCGFECNAGFHACGTNCVANGDIATCGTSCTACPIPAHASASSCDGTSCGVTCDASYHACGTTCAANSDPATCGISCSACVPPTGGSATCNGTQCGGMCPGGQKLCAGVCIPMGDACTGVCQAMTHDCGGLCASNNSVNSCGASCSPCAVPANSATVTCDGTNCGFTCVGGYHPCGNQCLSDSDVGSCGTLCSACPAGPANSTPICTGALTCDWQCTTLFKKCGAICISRTTCCDSSECTLTGQTCSGVGGSCNCPSGQKPCIADGKCIDNANCCGNAECDGVQSLGRSCSSANNCSYTGCVNGFKNCNMSAPDTDGCETVFSDPDHCNCNNVCPMVPGATRTCTDGMTCGFTCNTPAFRQCGAHCYGTDFDDYKCANTTDCTASGKICVNNTCVLPDTAATSMNGLIPGNSQPIGVVVDSTYMHFTTINGSSPGVWRCPIAGCGAGATKLSAETFPRSIVISGGNLIWVNLGGDIRMLPVGAAAATVPTIIATGLTSAYSLAADASNVYIIGNTGASPQQVLRCPLAAGCTPTLLTSALVAGSGSFITVAGGVVYFSIDTAVYSSPATGMNNTATLLTGNRSPKSIKAVAVDADSFYYVDGLDGAPTTKGLYRCPLSGCLGNANEFLTPGAASTAIVSPNGLWLDATAAYVTDLSTAGAIWKIPICGGTAINLTKASGAASPIRVTSDANFVYWTTFVGGAVPSISRVAR